MIFVSYSRSDINQIRPFADLLSQEHVDYWIDESNIPVGQAFVENLGNALRKADSFVLVDTTASRLSYWVWREIQTASRYRRYGRFHTMLRIYSPGCEASDLSNWDTSIPFNEHSHSCIAKFVAGRRMSSQLKNHDETFPCVAVHGETGLGQPSNWIGRHDELRDLDEWWFGSSLGVWLAGLGGIGKSGLLQTWVTSLSYFGYRKNTAVSAFYLSGRDIHDLEETHTRLMVWISKNTTQKKLLLVDGHDESPQPENVDKLLRYAIHSGIKTIVTSRAMCTESLTKDFVNINFKGMSRKDSLSMLDQHFGSSPANNEIATELDDHPLALTMFSRSVITKDQRPEKALENLRRIKIDDPTTTPDHLQSIRASICESVGNLTPDARTLLERIVQSEGTKFEQSDLMNPLLQDLTGAALIQVDHLDSPTQLSIHPLVRSFINDNRSIK